MLKMNITAADVNKLRQQTGAGMMDCKNALQEAEGDFEAAIDILRKKGQKVAAKRSDRDAAEGVVIAKTTADGKQGAVMVLNCETDFVAKNEAFGKVAEAILDAAIQGNATSIDEVKALNYPGSNLKIADKITEEIGKIGEKIELSSFDSIKAAKVVAYNHPGNQLASLVGFNHDVTDEMAKDVAMQVAAMNPVSVDQDSIPQAMIDKELEIGKELAIQEGKPADMADKIAQGRLNKWFKEATLLNQPFIKDNKKSIQEYMADANKDLTVTSFRRHSLS
jgi:elongation factor Ts